VRASIMKHSGQRRPLRVQQSARASRASSLSALKRPRAGVGELALLRFINRKSLFPLHQGFKWAQEIVWRLGASMEGCYVEGLRDVLPLDYTKCGGRRPSLSQGKEAQAAPLRRILRPQDRTKAIA